MREAGEFAGTVCPEMMCVTKTAGVLQAWRGEVDSNGFCSITIVTFNLF